MKSLTYPALFTYGLFGLPLALVALPIYVYVPQFYAEQFGLSLALIGSALLITRILDAFIDPVIGLWIDRRRNVTGYNPFIAMSLPLLMFGFVALFHPPQRISAQPMLWFMFSLMITYLGFSLATIAYQSWGAALTQARSQRSRLTAVREACGLVGVIIAAALPGFAGVGWLSWVFVATLLAAALLLLGYAPRPGIIPSSPAKISGWLVPFANLKFRWLFSVYLLNGIAAAIPATLFLFFVSDRLEMPQYSGIFLMLYFIAAACSMPIWAALARRHGEQRAWMAGMGLAIATFVWAFTLAAGDAGLFSLICTLSGLSLGADLALPPALLAAVIGHAGHSGSREGAYFGIWSWATKMNLALAAGIALPLLELLGYHTGTSNPQGLKALAIGYALLPCLLKFLAVLLLWRAPLHHV